MIFVRNIIHKYLINIEIFIISCMYSKFVGDKQQHQNLLLGDNVVCTLSL